MVRRLRIAVSVFFAVLTVLLCVLWVRSYWYMDRLHGPISQTRAIECLSVNGHMLFAITKLVIPVQRLNWSLESIDSRDGAAQSESQDTIMGFVYGEIDYWTIWGPHWFLTMIAATLAAALWFRVPYRFSLRTMLIATTLLAVVLGLAVWLAA
jgi:hypothetical protein